MTASKPFVGSSAIIHCGWAATAIAAKILCLIPPDNSNGYKRAVFLGFWKAICSKSFNISSWLFALLFCDRRKTSSICFPTRILGFKEVAGFCATKAISFPRTLHNSFSFREVNSLFPYIILPKTVALGCNNPKIERPRTDFPLPVSPIIPVTLLSGKDNDTWFTAGTSPESVANRTDKFRIDISISLLLITCVMHHHPDL